MAKHEPNVGPARKRRQFATAAKQKLHEEALARRRAKHHERRTAELASQAAEGQADWENLVRAERERQEGIAADKAFAGSKSPKVTVAARDNLAKAFDLMGGVPALVVWGRSNPTEFYRLWARLIPKEAAAETAMPLEELLTKLASKEGKSVGDAAWEIGMETLEEGRRGAEAEDAAIAAYSKSLN